MRVQCSGPSRPQLRTQAKADRTLAAVEHQDRRRAVWKRVPNLVIPGTFDTPSAWSSRVPNAESYPLLLAFPPSCSILSDNQTVKFRGATSEFAVPLHMFLDLNVPIPNLQPSGSTAVAPQSKKGKAAAKQTHPQQPEPSFSPAQIAAIENRVELLIHLGYSVFAFNQTIHKKLDPKTHQNLAQTLVRQLKRRPGVVFLKRITIVLDEDSEKGFGLASTSSSIFSGYDIIALTPTTPGTLSLACLTHSQPSTLTAHVISLPLTLPRLPFHLKHTLIRTAVKNGAVFEMNYSGAFGNDSDALETASAAIKRNWWAAAREVIRVTKGKGVIVSGGITNEPDLRAPRDIINLITMLDLAPDLAHGTMGKEPQALVLRAQTRKTYRAILSEPKLVIPGAQPQPAPPPLEEVSTSSTSTPTPGTKRAFDDIGDAPGDRPSKTEPRSNKKRKNKQR